jgi:hypothetical protein
MSRTASLKIPPAWKKKPSQTNLISPNEARETPKTMNRTLSRTLILGEATRKAQDVMRTATGADAWGVVSKVLLRYIIGRCLSCEK